jgi:hypothetical protein
MRMPLKLAVAFAETSTFGKAGATDATTGHCLKSIPSALKMRPGGQDFS